MQGAGRVAMVVAVADHPAKAVASRRDHHPDTHASAQFPRHFQTQLLLVLVAGICRHA